MTSAGSAARGARVAWIAVALAVATGCATPIGVDRVTEERAQRELRQNALWAGVPSVGSAQVLRRAGLGERFESEPEEVLRLLHARLADDGQDDLLFALSELSYLHAMRSKDRAWSLASAVYAYALLFPGGGETTSIPPSDPRYRAAYDFYNRALADAFASDVPTEMALVPGPRTLPFGRLDVTLAPPPSWGGYRLDRFADVGLFSVRGLANHYRQPGIGAPLAASLAAEAEGGGDVPASHQRIPPKLKIPVTALLRLENPRAKLQDGALTGRLEVYERDDAREVTVEGRTVPLEIDSTAPLAYTLEGSAVWDFEIAGFFSSAVSPLARAVQGTGVAGQREGDGLVLLHPYRPGRFPLVLVHGTASSPARWAELVNELENDPRIADRFQVWLFTYNTGNPIVYTAGLLREALERVVLELDPEGRDPALRQMVVMGHSQGGLLTKTTAVDTGDRFWMSIWGAPLGEIRTDPETRELLRRSFFYTPLPGVKRVVFVATPHRGSYLATFSLARWLTGLISLPADLTGRLTDLATANEGATFVAQVRRLPTSVDNMTPGHPFLKNLLDIPIAPGIRSHSIIPVLGDGPLEQEKDGVVAYTSAHLDGVDSEKVIRHSGHSTQGEPETIEEVRRILREHIAESDAARGGVAAPGAAGEVR